MQGEIVCFFRKQSPHAKTTRMAVMRDAQIAPCGIFFLHKIVWVAQTLRAVKVVEMNYRVGVVLF